MKLFILRHGEADSTSPDSSRRLTPKGHKQTKELAQALNPQELKNIKAIWHSTLIRAKETAQIFQIAASLSAPIKEVEYLAPSSSIDSTCEALSEIDHDLVLVGHNPHLSELAAYLLTSSHDANLVDLKKSSIICLEKTSAFIEMRPAGSWTLRWYITPKVL